MAKITFLFPLIIYFLLGKICLEGETELLTDLKTIVPRKAGCSRWNLTNIFTLDRNLRHKFCFYYTTVCPGRSDPFYIVSYYIKWVTTSWTHGMSKK